MSTPRHSETIWYSFQSRVYNGSAPEFYDNAQFPWVQQWEADFPEIRSEIERLIAEHRRLLVPYFNETLASSKEAWKTMVFFFWGKRNNELMDASPLLEKKLVQIPGFISAAVSKLEAGAEIDWHPGDTSGVVRCHLPIHVPGTLPECGFQVREEQRSWVEGQFLLFCDAHRHRAFNHTKEDRFVLIIDVIHPDFQEERKAILRNVRSILWLQKVDARFPFFQKMPRFIRSAMRRLYLLFA